MDENFKRTHASRARILRRSCESLLGICQGILADGVLNANELRFLELWLREHAEISEVWPGCVVQSRISDVLSDGKTSAEELKQLASVLQSLVGESWAETGAVDGFPANLPIQRDVQIQIEGRQFCFTGSFAFGTRSACHRAVIELGGSARATIVKDLDYLVIGTFVAPDWAQTSFGRKIEKAVRYRSQGCKIAIVSEQYWCQVLENN